MVRWVPQLIAAILAGFLGAGQARAQAAAAYAVAASKSTALGAKAKPLVTPKVSPLSQRSAPRTSPTQVDVLGQNRQKLEAASGASGGELHVESLPAKAIVSIDGAPVAHTPADLKLPEGNHVVELALPGFLPWRKEITVSRDGNMLLKAELRNQYKSEVTFSRWK